MIYFLNIGAVALVAGVAWWLTSYDSNLAGDGRRSDFWRRFLRVIGTLFLVEAMIVVPPTAIFLSVAVGVVWAGCLSELLSRWGRKFLDPGFHDDRPLDPGKGRRHLDTIAHLIQTGRRAEAIKLCEELKLSGDVDLVTLEMTLEFLGVRPERAQLPKPLAEAGQMRAQGKFAEAEKLLNALLKKNPEDLAAAMMLVRLYAQDLRRPSQAHEVLRRLELQPHVAAAHIEFARRSIDDWSRTPPERRVVPAPVESVDELLAQGFFGTAIERLEQQTAAQPSDFDSWLKLAEAHGRHSGNVPRAEKIVRQLEASPAFNSEQKQRAKNELAAWRNAGIRGK